eukprot:scaffold154095_cov16-Prasinocladus_malaysianus.AAC.1
MQRPVRSVTSAALSTALKSAGIVYSYRLPAVSWQMANPSRHDNEGLKDRHASHFSRSDRQMMLSEMAFSQE